MRALGIELFAAVSDSLQPPGSSVHGILQARILEWVAIPSSRDLSDPGTEPKFLAFQADSLPSEPSGNLVNAKDQPQSFIHN